MEDNMLIVMHLKACAQIYDLANMLHDEMYVYKWTYFVGRHVGCFEGQTDREQTVS